MMKPAQKKLKGNFMTYLGVLSMVAFAALIIIVSTLVVTAGKCFLYFVNPKYTRMCSLCRG